MQILTEYNTAISYIVYNIAVSYIIYNIAVVYIMVNNTAVSYIVYQAVVNYIVHNTAVNYLKCIIQMLTTVYNIFPSLKERKCLIIIQLLTEYIYRSQCIAVKHIRLLMRS